ncbi:hypothetical protein V2J09_015745 [Rumex salicifolius]
MSNSLKGRPGLGGLSSGSKLAVKALGVEPYTIDGVALIQIFGISTHNSRAVAASLNSYECYILQTGTSTFIWQGNQSPFEQQQLAVKVEEIYNFTQDDLLTEDTLILDTHADVFVLVGHTVDPKEKQKAFEMGEKYIALAASLEGLPQQVPLYKITEGN